MWLGELVTDRGIGNGMSILMFISIAAGFPGALWAIKQQGKLADGWIEFGAVILVGLAMVGPGGLRRAGPAPHPGAVREAHDRPPVLRRYVHVHPAEGEPGGCDSRHLRVVAALHPGPDRPVQRLDGGLGDVDHAPTSPRATTRIYIATYFLLIVFFAFFYVAISFNPEEVADNMKKYGGFIPGIRAGRPTAEYLSYVLNRITWPGSLYLGLIALVPTVALVVFNGATRTSRSAGRASSSSWVWAWRP